MNYFAHKSEDNVRMQTVKEHVDGVAEVASGFAEIFQAGKLAYLAGELHDIGKYSVEFQDRLLRNGVRVDHSTAGAKELHKYGAFLSVEYCIAGHHGGLPDGGTKDDTEEESTLSGRLKKSKIPDYASYKDEIKIEEIVPKPADMPKLNIAGNGGFTLAFFTRMLYSCLVDGDFLDTEAFMSDGGIQRGMGDLSDLYQQYHSYINKFADPIGELNQARNHILQQCLKFGTDKKGLYSLTVPTGGGKTLASLGFAMEQVRTRGMERIIYVIPYTSIIEQTAGIFQDIFGKEAVLEHHMGVSYEDESDISYRQKLATENWDAPIVVTTNVQFFESLYSNRPSQCRKLHNIANSVIIFDEAQMLPLPSLKPCIQAVTELIINYGCSAVMCSATQPALDSLFPNQLKMEEINNGFEQLEPIFRRTNFKLTGQLSDLELMERFMDNNQVLCIVNTRKHAKRLFELLPEEGSYHLSTLMRPIERKSILKEIRKRLKENKVCRVVSTSLIEAGVDVDFPTVYRAEAGLDSEIQAGGRCNREGKRPQKESIVFIFIPEEQYRLTQPLSMRQLISVQQMIQDKYRDILSKEAIREYFEILYEVRGDENLDTLHIVERFESGRRSGNFPFASVSAQFHMIDNSTIPIVIPLEEEAKQLVKQLQYGLGSINLIRKLAFFSVNVYSYQFEALLKQGVLQVLLDGKLAVLLDEKLYDQRKGLTLDGETGIGIFF